MKAQKSSIVENLSALLSQGNALGDALGNAIGDAIGAAGAAGDDADFTLY